MLSGMMILLSMSASCHKGNQPASTEQATPKAEQSEPNIQVSTRNAQPQSTSSYNDTDARAFGLLGHVEKVITTTYDATLNGNRLIRGNKSDQKDSPIAFNAQGLVTADPFFNTYEYDEQGKFKRGLADYTTMERDANGRVASYDHQQDDEDADCHHHTFTYDEQGRLVKVGMGFYETTYDYAFTYEGNNLWPATEAIDGMDEGQIYKETTRFRYTRFDDHGNWIEREMRISCMEAEENDLDGSLTNKKEYKLNKIQTRDIKYYD